MKTTEVTIINKGDHVIVATQGENEWLITEGDDLDVDLQTGAPILIQIATEQPEE